METFEIGLKKFCIMVWAQTCKGQGVESCKGQGVECGGLNGDSLHELIYVNIWSWVGGTF